MSYCSKKCQKCIKLAIIFGRTNLSNKIIPVFLISSGYFVETETTMFEVDSQFGAEVFSP